MRAHEITTDEGVGFRVFDPESPARLDTRTATLTGSHDWTSLSVDFAVPPGTHLVEIRAVRRPSQRFDNKLGGTAWIDQAAARATRRQQ